MEIHIVKQYDNTFKVVAEDYDKIKKLKPLQVVKCKITQPRNIKFHRKFFALIDLVYNNQEHYDDRECLRKDLTIASGFYTQHKTFNGKMRTEAKSISFSKMTEQSFSELYNSFLDTIEKYFKFDKQSVKDEIDKNF